MTEHSQFGPTKTTPSETETQAMGGCLTRIVWLIAAPLTLVMLGAVIAREGHGVTSVASLAYWAVVLVTVTVRYFDIFRYRGETMDGAPASRDDWRRYRLRFPALALTGWSAALAWGAL